LIGDLKLARHRFVKYPKGQNQLSFQVNPGVFNGMVFYIEPNADRANQFFINLRQLFSNDGA